MKQQKPKNITNIIHNPATNELQVTFHNGATYKYSGVSAEQHKELVNAKSIGEHFHKNIKDKHAFVKDLRNVYNPASKRSIK